MNLKGFLSSTFLLRNISREEKSIMKEIMKGSPTSKNEKKFFHCDLEIIECPIDCIFVSKIGLLLSEFMF